MLNREESSRQERAVLSAMLKDHRCVAEVLQIVRAEHFREDAHRTVFSSMCCLFCGGETPDVVTLAGALKREGQLANVGGYGFLVDLAAEGIGSPAIAAQYARAVRDAYTLREIGYAAADIGSMAASPEYRADEVLEKAQERLFGIAESGVVGGAEHARVAVAELRQRIDAQKARGGAYSGLPTGFVDLDHLTGGMQDSELILVGARPSTGKTSLAISVIDHLCLSRSVPVFFASLEQSRVELVERLTCCHAGVDSHKVKRGDMDVQEQDRFCSAAELIERRPLFIDDSAAQSVLRIIANARRLKSQHGIRLVIIDYLGLIQPSAGDRGRQEQVAGISRGLKLLAKEVRLPVLCLAQLNRQAENRPEERPKLSDLRDSGGQEQDADAVILLWRSDKTSNVVNVLLEKQRNGPTGPVELYFRRECYRFENLGQGNYGAPPADPFHEQGGEL